MRIGIPKEIHPGERRVAATPMTVAKMRKLGLDVVVQAGAGEESDYGDGAYIETGAVIVPDAATLWEQADLVLKVRPPQAYAEGELHEADRLREGCALIGFVWPGQNPVARRAAREARSATVFAMDAVPRITRAQKMDALSAMANIVGYRSVLEGASALGRFLGGQMTAAGTRRARAGARAGRGRGGSRRHRVRKEPGGRRARVRHPAAGARAGREPRRARSSRCPTSSRARARGATPRR